MKFCLAKCLQFTLFSYLWITSLCTQMLTMGTERLLLYSDYYSGVFMPVCLQQHSQMGAHTKA